MELASVGVKMPVAYSLVIAWFVYRTITRE